jgi:hypothetical protein
MKLTTFRCDLCGKERTERTCWYKKRQNHFCSRQCANTANARKKATGMTRTEYMRWYWSQPENFERRKKSQSEASRRRVAAAGVSAKKIMLARVKARALENGIPFGLTVSDFDIPDVCPVLGIPLTPQEGRGGGPNSPSLDRITPALGYVRGNVVVISKRANIIKSDATADEIQKVADWLKANVSPLGSLQS